MENSMTPSIWKNCYSEQWAGILIPQAFAHPAKVSLALAKRIFSHALENGWIKKGDRVLDPFAGVGGFAFAASLAGVKFVGQELEKHFVDLANGVDCTGISKEDWVRYYGRFDKVNTGRSEYGFHWCPQCLAQAKQIMESRKETADLFGKPSTASYERNSGKIPSTGSHHFEGNLEFWRRRFNLNGAVIVQGDSRKLLENLQGRVECVVSSPPYETDGLGHRGKASEIDSQKRLYHRIGNNQYSDSKSNLGNLPAGNLDAVISSPPYAGGHALGRSGNDERESLLPAADRIGKSGWGNQYGQSVGQLGAMRDKDYDMVVSSPPYVNSVHDGNGIDTSKLTGNIAGKNSQVHAEGYGESGGQLGSMPEGCFDFVASSPPFEDMNMGCNSQGVRKDLKAQGRSPEVLFGQSDGQLRGSGETFWSAAREIIQQCFLALKPGGHAIFVTKNFIRDGKIVQFSQQWATLCKSVGFKLVCWHQAELNRSGGVQLCLDGSEYEKIISTKSFFRRLIESKGAPPINHEDVLCMQKPNKTFERLFIDGRNGVPRLEKERVEL